MICGALTVLCISSCPSEQQEPVRLIKKWSYLLGMSVERTSMVMSFWHRNGDLHAAR